MRERFSPKRQPPQSQPTAPATNTPPVDRFVARMQRAAGQHVASTTPRERFTQAVPSQEQRDRAHAPGSAVKRSHERIVTERVQAALATVRQAGVPIAPVSGLDATAADRGAAIATLNLRALEALAAMLGQAKEPPPPPTNAERRGGR